MQGKTPYTINETANTQSKYIEWDITRLAKEHLAKLHDNNGWLIKGLATSAPATFYSREHSNESYHPKLRIRLRNASSEISSSADTYLSKSTTTPLGKRDQLQLVGGSSILIKFELPKTIRYGDVEQIKLRLYYQKLYGNKKVKSGIFRSAPGGKLLHELPTAGLAENYPQDNSIHNDKDVIFANNFESKNWKNGFDLVNKNILRIDKKAATTGSYIPLDGGALRIRIPKSMTFGTNLSYFFKEQIGKEPEEIYFRYYLRLGDNWAPSTGGKLPGIAGTYKKAGWGGRRSTGINGWSARGLFRAPLPQNNPLSNKIPIGTYLYHANMAGSYGDDIIWSRNARGILKKNRWYCIEQYIRLNDPQQSNGILQTWVDGRASYFADNLKFRSTSNLKIERIWLNVYHGGSTPAPQDLDLYIDNVVVAKKYIGPTLLTHNQDNFDWWMKFGHTSIRELVISQSHY